VFAPVPLPLTTPADPEAATDAVAVAPPKDAGRDGPSETDPPRFRMEKLGSRAVDSDIVREASGDSIFISMITESVLGIL
jgi:hypothetical protein